MSEQIINMIETGFQIVEKTQNSPKSGKIFCSSPGCCALFMLHLSLAVCKQAPLFKHTDCTQALASGSNFSVQL